MTDPTKPDETKTIAEELASRLGREQGGALLERARAMLVLQASRPGTQTSEFKLAALAILAGVVLVALGATQPGQDDLVGRGIELVQWATVGYGVSRGLSKAGASKQLPPQPPLT